jgi:hypothetical protein
VAGNRKRTAQTQNALRGQGKPDKVDSQSYRRLALMWIEAVYLQIERLESAIDLFQQRASAQRFVDSWRERGRPKQWEGEYRKSMRLLRKRKPITVGPDKYFLLLCVAQLIKCVEALPGDDLPSFHDQELLRDLRNIEEHWDDVTGRSIRRVRLAIPDVEPGRIASNNKHIWIEGIDLMSVLEWTAGVHRQLRNAQNLWIAGKGRTFPVDRVGLEQGRRWRVGREGTPGADCSSRGRAATRGCVAAG